MNLTEILNADEVDLELVWQHRADLFAAELAGHRDSIPVENLNLYVLAVAHSLNQQDVHPEFVRMTADDLSAGTVHLRDEQQLDDGPLSEAARSFLRDCFTSTQEDEEEDPDHEIEVMTGLVRDLLCAAGSGEDLSMLEELVYSVADKMDYLDMLVDADEEELDVIEEDDDEDDEKEDGDASAEADEDELGFLD